MTRLLALFSVIVCINAAAQERQNPVVFDSVIGDTLDTAERTQYVILPNITGFEKAVFYLNPDSSLRVRVFLLQDGVRRDTIIARYHTLAWMRNRIDAIRVSEEKPPPEDENVRQDKLYRWNDGEYTVVTCVDGAQIEGELLSVRANALIIYSGVMGDSLVADDFHIKVLPNSQIRTAYLPGVHSVGTILLGLFGGALVGALTCGLIIQHEVNNRPAREDGPYHVSMGDGSEGTVFAGYVLGAVIGAVIGYDIGWVISEGKSYSNDGAGFTILKFYARYPEQEPDYLRMFK
jgi:hypothetical protein